MASMDLQTTPTLDNKAVSFDVTADDILSKTMTMIAKERLLLDEISSVETPTFDNVIAPIIAMHNLHEAEYNVNGFLQKISPIKSVREASAELETLHEDFKAECLVREDVYKAICAVFKNKEEMENMSPEDRRLVKSMEREYRREGTALCEDKRKELTKCKFRLAELELTFTRNIDNHEGKALFTRGELEGLPESYFTGRATKDIAGNTKFIVTTQPVDYFPLMNYAKLEATRRAMFLIQNTRCTDNLELLDEAVKLRLEMAKILGYNTHAEYALEPHMAKTPQAAYDMLAELRNNLTSLGRTELEELESLKRRDMEDVGRIYEGFNEWDRSFYTRMLHKNKHSIDDNKVKCYFSLATVIRGILEHYQTTFGVNIVEMENASVWHTDVEMYEVWSCDNNNFIGHFYLDLFQRPDKCPRISAYNIRSGFETNDNTRQYPAVAMVASFSKPSSSSKVFLSHAQVEMLIGELGRVFQNLLCKTKYARFHGFNSLEPDFALAPSQVLKNWVWNADALCKIAKHHETNESIPQDLVKQLLAAKNEGAGLVYLRHVFFAMYDLAINNSEDGNVDVNSLFNTMNTDISLISCGATKTSVVAKFSNFIKHNLASKYYAHLWSQVCSADIFATCFLQDGVDAADVGMAFRNLVLQPGGSQDSSDSLRAFLGREPTCSAFLASIGCEK